MHSRNLDAKAIFKVACLIDSREARDAYLRQVCGDDGGVYDRVITLLKAHDDGSDFLESPAAGIAATVDLPPIAERPGTQIGPYKLLQEIGEGGMGVVYMAHQREPVRRKVALKIIKPGMDTREVIARFEAERQALAMMDHPNIAKVHEAGSTEMGRPYFVMELVNGVPITEYCDDNNLTTDERLELFVLVCNAVQHAHQKGIIHRDIKPSNILVTMHDGVPVPKIIDFGIAKAINQELTANTMYTGFGEIVGTPIYMSPEQAERSGLDVDTRSDIYSLGVLLYELLTGTTPFDSEQLKESGLDEFRRLLREEEPARPSTRISTMGKAATTVSQHRRTDPAELSNTLRQEIDWIVMKALDKDRTRRYDTAADFARDVQRHLNDEAVVACPPTTMYGLRKFTRRNRVAVFTTTAIALALILGAGVATGQAYRATKAEQFANKQLENAREQRRLAKEQERLAKEQKRLADAAAKRERELRSEAEAARTQAEQVTKFVVDIFRSPDPERDGRQITIAEMLDKAAVRIDSEFEQDLPVQARLREAIGQTYSALSLPREAVGQLATAHDLYRQTLGKSDRTTIFTAYSLALAHEAAGSYTDARRLAEEAAIQARDAFGPKDELTLVTRHVAAQTLQHSPKAESLDAALQELTDLLPLYQEHFGAEHDKTLTLMSNLAHCHHQANQPQKALALLEKAYGICQRNPDTGEEITLLLMHNLGCQSGAEKGIPLLEEALELNMARYGPNHSSTINTMSYLTHYYFVVGRKDDMIAMAEGRWTGALASLGLENPQTLEAGMTLLWAYEAYGGRHEDILKLSQQLFPASELHNIPRDERIRTLVYGLGYRLRTYAPERATELFGCLLPWEADPAEDVVKSLPLKMLSAKACSELGRHGESVKMVEEVLSIATQHHCSWRLYYDSAVVYFQANRLADAVAMLDEALTLVHRPIRRSNGERLFTRRAEANLGLGNIEQALADADRYLALGRAAQPPDHHAQIGELIRAELLLLAGRDEEYREACQDVLKQYGQSKNPSDFCFVIPALVLAPNAISGPSVAVELASRANSSSAGSLHTLGMAHLRAGKIEAAVARFQESLRAGPGSHARYLNWLGLSIACQQRGESKEARAWLAQAVAMMDSHPAEWAQGRLEGQILRREAEGLLEISTEETGTGQKQDD